MKGCRSKKCGQKFEPGWSFCPSCGKDNRPKEFRPEILNCAHRFEGPRKFCVTCGKSRRAATAGSGRDTGFATFLIKTGVVLIVASAAAWKIHAAGGGLGYSWVSPWYDQPFQIPGVATLRGNDYPIWAGTIGTVAFAFGPLGVMAAKFGSPKAKKTRPKAPSKTRQSSAPSAPTL